MSDKYLKDVYTPPVSSITDAEQAKRWHAEVWECKRLLSVAGEERTQLQSEIARLHEEVARLTVALKEREGA